MSWNILNTLDNFSWTLVGILFVSAIIQQTDSLVDQTKYTPIRISGALPHWSQINDFNCSLDETNEWFKLDQDTWNTEDEDWITFKCLPPLWWYVFRQKPEEAWTASSYSAWERVSGAFFADWFYHWRWYRPFIYGYNWWPNWGTMNIIHDENGAHKMGDNLISRWRPEHAYFSGVQSAWWSWPVWLYWEAFAAFLCLFLVYTVAMFGTHFILYSYYISSFVFYVPRKLGRWFLVFSETIKRTRRNHLAPFNYHPRRPNWRLLYFFRDHDFEERPYQLSWRQPPNLINYEMCFIRDSDYHQHDLEIYEIEMIDEYLLYREEFPQQVSMAIKGIIGPKYENYFEDTYDLDYTSSSSEEHLKLESETSSSSTSSISSEDSDGNKRGRMTAEQREAKKREERRLEREKAWFHKLRLAKRTPEHLLPPNEFKIPRGAKLNREQWEELKRRGEKLLFKQRHFIEGTVETPVLKFDPRPTAYAVGRTTKLKNMLIPLVNELAHESTHDSNWRDMKAGTIDDEDDFDEDWTPAMKRFYKGNKIKAKKARKEAKRLEKEQHRIAEREAKEKELEELKKEQENKKLADVEGKTEETVVLKPPPPPTTIKTDTKPANPIRSVEPKSPDHTIIQMPSESEGETWNQQHSKKHTLPTVPKDGKFHAVLPKRFYKKDDKSDKKKGKK